MNKKSILLACIISSSVGALVACRANEPTSAPVSSTAAAQNAAPAPTKAEGVAPDGTKIMFANQRERAAAATPPSAPPDRAHLVTRPTSPDPENGEFTLAESVVGLGTDGTLVAEISTDLGTITCDLFADKTPLTVANFIGLARGIRPWWDARSGTWKREPAYDNTTFHRVIPGFMIQGGDALGDGTGEPGYLVPDEMRPDLRHDRVGQLCMANRGPNTNGAQFFITDAPTPQLDGYNTYTIFGQCKNEDVVARIARVPQSGRPRNNPLTPVVISRVRVRRVVGGAANARPIAPVATPEASPQSRGASPSPTELNSGARIPTAQQQRFMESIKQQPRPVPQH